MKRIFNKFVKSILLNVYMEYNDNVVIQTLALIAGW